MSIYYLSELESQVNQYFKSQNTMALADSTKALYNAVLKKKLLPFCEENGITKLNETVLQDIASEGEGEYIDGSNTSDAVEQIKEILIQMDKTEFEAKQFAEYKDQFQWFVGAGILFLFLDVFVLDKKTKWLKKLNLFNEKNRETI